MSRTPKIATVGLAPTVSVIIPTYNRVNDLRRAIDSLLAQSFSDWELIVVDNHSSDGTVDYLHGLRDGRISVELVHNEGVIAVSRNRGVTKARGSYIAFLDSDDWWTPDKLERAVGAMEAGHDVVYHDLFLVRMLNQRRLHPTGHVRPVSTPVFEDLLLRGNALANSSVVVRADLLRAMGPLREDRDLIGMEDFDAWLRLARLTDRFLMLENTLGYYWAGGGNTTNPERTLRALGAFREIYAAEISRKGEDIAWLNYAAGRAWFQLGQFRHARRDLGRLSLRRLTPMLALKTAYMRLAVGFSR